MTQAISRPCWICGGPADSGEHRRKRSDLIARYGRSWTPEQQPLVIRGDGSDRLTRIQGPNDRLNIYGNMLCKSCNSDRTQRADLAYQEFSDWVFASADTLHEKQTIDFSEIYGEDYIEKTGDLMRYFAKSLGCRIKHGDLEVPGALREIVGDATRVTALPLAVTFSINEAWRRIDPSGRAIGDDCFNNWPNLSDRECFSWFQVLGYLQISYWYDLEWEEGYPYGGEAMSGPCRRVELGRYDLPSEAADEG